MNNFNTGKYNQSDAVYEFYHYKEMLERCHNKKISLVDFDKEVFSPYIAIYKFESEE